MKIPMCPPLPGGTCVALPNRIWNKLVVRVLGFSSILEHLNCRSARDCNSARVRKCDVLRNVSQSERLTSVCLLQVRCNVLVSVRGSSENSCTSTIRKTPVIECCAATKQRAKHFKNHRATNTDVAAEGKHMNTRVRRSASTRNTKTQH